MTLGQLIEALKEYDSDKTVVFDWPDMVPCDVYSWRGDYEQLAIDYKESSHSERPLLKEFLSELQDAIGRTFPGYRGGEFMMYEHTPVHVAKYSYSGRCCVSGVTKGELGEAVIQTEHREYEPMPNRSDRLGI